MISNERPSPWGQKYHGLSKSPVQEDTVRLEQFQVERKTVTCALKENSRGRFLRISEEVGGKRNSIIIPTAGLRELRAILDQMIQTDAISKLAELH